MNLNVMSRIAFFALLSLSVSANARNEYKDFSIENAMALDAYKAKLSPEIRFYFGTGPSSVVKKIGEWPTLKKTNAFNKSDEYACQWALLSALMSLQKRALKEGGNAVIVKTNNDHRPRSNPKVFECEIGNVIASVALLGTVVKANR